MLKIIFLILFLRFFCLLVTHFLWCLENQFDAAVQSNKAAAAYVLRDHYGWLIKVAGNQIHQYNVQFLLLSYLPFGWDSARWSVVTQFHIAWELGGHSISYRSYLAWRWPFNRDTLAFTYFFYTSDTFTYISGYSANLCLSLKSPNICREGNQVEDFVSNLAPPGDVFFSTTYELPFRLSYILQVDAGGMGFTMNSSVGMLGYRGTELWHIHWQIIWVQFLTFISYNYCIFLLGIKGVSTLFYPGSSAYIHYFCSVGLHLLMLTPNPNNLLAPSALPANSSEVPAK